MGYSIWVETCAAMLLRNKWANPLRPWVPIAIMSALILCAKWIMPSPTVKSFIPDFAVELFSQT